MDGESYPDMLRRWKQRKMFPTQDAWRAWQDGAVGLSDFVGHHQSKTWGTSIYQRSGRDAMERTA